LALALVGVASSQRVQRVEFGSFLAKRLCNRHQLMST
jgi:hypothetical protein